MAASYTIDPDRSLLCVEHVGRTDAQSVHEVIDRLLADPLVRPGLRMLSDHTRATNIATRALVFQTVPRFSELMEQLGAFRCAVVTHKTVQIGMTHVAAVYARRRGIELRPFRSRKEAEAWLLEDEEIDPMSLSAP